MATVKQCRSALKRLAASLDGVDAESRSRHLPRRSVSCTVPDLDVSFSALVDETGVHDITLHEGADPAPGSADVRIVVHSDDLVDLADGRQDFLTAWLRGRVQVSAPMRDMLRLRSLLGLI